MTSQVQDIQAVQEYVLKTLPQLNAEVQTRVQQPEQLTLVQLLGMTEVALNTMICGAGLLGGPLELRWPKTAGPLQQVLKQRDWFLVSPTTPGTTANLYMTGLTTANVIFKVLVRQFPPEVVEQLLAKALTAGVKLAQQYQVQLTVVQHDNDALVQVK